MLTNQRRLVLVAFAPLLTMAIALDGCRRDGADPAGAVLPATDPTGLGGRDSGVAHATPPAPAPGGQERETRAVPWASWPMPNARLPGLPHPHDYDLTTPDVARDRVTGLEWQRKLPNQFFTYQDAGQHCADLRLAGHS